VHAKKKKWARKTTMKKDKKRDLKKLVIDGCQTTKCKFFWPWFSS